MQGIGFFLRDIKIAHSVFALPFACATLLLTPSVAVNWQDILLLLGCLVFARSYAMGMNRVIDYQLDAMNTRTSKRMIPQGKVSWLQALGWSLLCAAIFVFLTASLNQTAFFCSFPVLAILGFYPLTKRFTVGCHWYLGMCLGLTPVAVLVALGAEVSAASIVLGISVMMWTAGFDIIYALQDTKFDRRWCLHSAPALFGIKTALQTSKWCFGIAILGLGTVGYLASGKIWYWLGVGVCALLLAIEQLLLARSIATNSLTAKKVMQIFFRTNACVSLSFLFFVTMDVWFTWE